MSPACIPQKWIIRHMSGYKTYIIATLMVCVGLVHLLSGDVSLVAFLNDPYLLVVLNGVGLASLRAGVSKIQ